MTYQDLEAALRRAGSPCDAAECHGTLCGLICSGAANAEAVWLEQILEQDASATARDALHALYLETRASLAGDEMRFTPLLPDDDRPLDERVEALVEWCQGFLYGLGIAELPPAERLSAEVQEVMRDFTEIARAGFEAGSQGEEDETAYAEIVEYLRVGAQLLHDELNAAGGGRLPPDRQLH